MGILKISINDNVRLKSSICHNVYSLLHKFHQPCAGSKGLIGCFLSLATFVLHIFIIVVI